MKVKGSITVFISIILSVLIAFSGIVADLSRFRAGEKHARAAVQLAVQSALTQYFAPLKDNYGLWANAYKKEELEVLIHDLTEKNLSVENMFMPGITDLFGFSVDSVTVYPMFNLADEYVLEKEITQYMKYRAPVNTIGLFLEKVKALNMFLAQSGLLNKRMELENKLQKVREEQVYLNSLLDEKIPLYMNNGIPMKDINENLISMSLLCSEINSLEKSDQDLDRAFHAMPPLIEKIKEARSKVNELKNEITEFEYELEPLERKYNQVEDSISDCYDKIHDIEREIEKLEGKISEAKRKGNADESLIKTYNKEIDNLKSSACLTESNIMFLNSELKRIEEDIRKIKQKILQKDDEIKIIKNSTEKDENQLRSHIDTCVKILGEIKQKSRIIKEKTVEVAGMVNKFIDYHEEAVELVSGIMKKSEEISRLSEEIDSEIKRQSEKSDNAFLVKINCDMKKLVLTARPEILNSIKADLDKNLKLLNEASNTIDSSIKKVDEILNRIQLIVNRTEQIYETLNYFEKEVFSLQLEEHVKNVNERISSTCSVYKNISYDLEPPVNKKEKNEFYRWCNRVFKEKNETEDRDKGYERTLRDNIEKADDKGKEETEKSFSGKDGELSDKQLEQMFESLPSNRNDQSGYLNSGEESNTGVEEQYKKLLDSNSNIASKIGDVLSGAGEALLKSLYVNEYIICAFKNANIDKVPTPRINLYGGPSRTFFEKAEVEYILFGMKKEKANANLTQMSLFGIRMGLNLLHIYMSANKTSAAMTAALSISGWTGFGVPIVKNLILFGWAAGESYIDLKDINDGKNVPLYKTENTWRLSLESIFTGIAGRFLDESSEWLKKTKDERIDKADDAVKELIRDIVSGAVNEVFLPLEQSITELGTEMDNVGNIGLKDPIIIYEINDMAELNSWVREICLKQYQDVKDRASDWTKAKLEDYKRKITDETVELIIDSDAYKKLFSMIKEGLDNVIEGSVTKVSDSLKQLGNKIGDQGLQSQLVGTVTSFDYTDYLRLLLFAVPRKTKLLRAADLIQLNMMETLDNPDFMMSEYNSFIIVEAEISMKAVFIPSFLKRSESGKFKIRWGYGY